ncbi:glutathione peroxidase [Chthonobacter rhizosphaerae]|uniref:glutathione peroxidase n=1 Tax=Chthonobacter rhizosphaerae TaxID=2735553 RepID=UPI0015EE9DBC|nr:glutathione peroxidase [Chthonobacter rhizosphaerae]
MIDRRALLLGTPVLVLSAVLPQRRALGAEGSIAGPAHRFLFDAIDGGPLPLSAYRGKLLLVVNTASQCAYTPQYRDLQALHESYGPRGLVVLGTPSNDFGGQEPGGEAAIKGFCTGEYGVTFPLTRKVHVRGAAAHPFYRWAAEAGGLLKAPRWNFHKYLVSPDGRLIDGFPSAMTPRDPRIMAVIEANLPT